MHRSSSSSAAIHSTSCSSILCLTIISRSKSIREAFRGTTGLSLLVSQRHSFKPLWDFLIRFTEQIDEIFHDVSIIVVKERSREPYNKPRDFKSANLKLGLLTDVTNATSTPDSVNIFVNIARQIKVDHVTHIRNIETARCHCCCY